MENKKGVKNVLLLITSGSNTMMIAEVNDYLQLVIMQV
jgi:hypothetical protein